ncbi:MAG: transcription elongation factor GreA [Minisyncoccia bacterium]
MKEVKEYLSKEKFEEFKNELQFLKTTKRKQIAEELDYARSLGDLSENAEYQEAREAQANLEDRIIKLELILKNAVIITEHAGHGVVEISSKIEVQKEGEKTPRSFTVVGSEEADMATGKVSNRSPFGMAVLGKKKGESFTYNSPKGAITYKIIDVK